MKSKNDDLNDSTQLAFFKHRKLSSEPCKLLVLNQNSSKFELKWCPTFPTDGHFGGNKNALLEIVPEGALVLKMF